MRSMVQAFQSLFGGSAPEPKPVEDIPKPTVLVIDDDNDLLEILRTTIRAAGFNVLATPSPAKGLDMLRFTRNNVGVVILDYNMPRLNGVEALVHLRKLSSQAKVIGLTGMRGDELPEEFSRGVDQLITKPCSNLRLVEAIHHIAGLTPAT